MHLKQPYDPHDPVALHIERPVLLTVQPESDPLDSGSLRTRTLKAALAPLTPQRNLPLMDLWSEFETLLPDLLAVLCTALSTALRSLPNVKRPQIPRLADAALWAIAAAPALGLTEHDILAALDPSQPPLVDAVKSFMDGHDGDWDGTATELADALNTELSPRGLSQHLRRQVAGLAVIGLHQLPSQEHHPPDHHFEA